MELYHEDTNHYFYIDNCDLTEDLNKEELSQLIRPILRMYVALNAVYSIQKTADVFDWRDVNFTGNRENKYVLQDTFTSNLELIAKQRYTILSDIGVVEWVSDCARLNYFREHFKYISMGINHGILYYTFVKFRPDTINVLYPILMPSILYTVFRKILLLKKSLNVKELEPKLVNILDGALGTLRYATTHASDVLTNNLLVNNTDNEAHWKTYASHVIHSTLNETYDDPIIF